MPGPGLDGAGDTVVRQLPALSPWGSSPMGVQTRHQTVAARSGRGVGTRVAQGLMGAQRRHLFNLGGMSRLASQRRSLVSQDGKEEEG